MKTVIIKACANAYCRSEYQDKRYGKRQRAHNAGSKQQGNRVKITCTVCGTKQDMQSSDLE